MAYKIDPNVDREWVDEFRKRPVGPHSPQLQRVLNTLRGGPLAGRYVLICTRPYREWVLARHPGGRSATSGARLGEPHDRELARRVVGKQRGALRAGERGGIDNDARDAVGEEPCCTPRGVWLPLLSENRCR